MARRAVTTIPVPPEGMLPSPDIAVWLAAAAERGELPDRLGIDNCTSACIALAYRLQAGDLMSWMLFDNGRGYWAGRGAWNRSGIVEALLRGYIDASPGRDVVFDLGDGNTLAMSSQVLIYFRLEDVLKAFGLKFAVSGPSPSESPPGGTKASPPLRESASSSAKPSSEANIRKWVASRDPAEGQLAAWTAAKLELPGVSRDRLLEIRREMPGVADRKRGRPRKAG